MCLSPELAWLVAGLVLMFLEFVVPGIILIFFGMGAVITALLTWIGVLPSIEVQLLFFAVGSLILLFSLRRVFSKYLKGKLDSEEKVGDSAEFLGKRVKVSKKIVPQSDEGKIEFDGTDWKAIADVEIERGEIVEIVGKKNITFFVKPIDKNNGN